jgi:protein TonB
MKIKSITGGVRHLLMGLGIAVIAACTVRQSEPPPMLSPAPDTSAAPSTTSPPADGPAAAAPPSRAWTLATYKLEVARWITRNSAAHLYEGAPPPVLKSIVVLTIAVDAAGKPTRVTVLRSNGYKALEQRALQSVTAAAPLPKPGLIVSRHGVAEFTETWLFREDGRFQLRSLALPQDEVEG